MRASIGTVLWIVLVWCFLSFVVAVIVGEILSWRRR